MQQDTVAAISTPPGEGGIGVIRISGENAIAVADKCFKAFSGAELNTLAGYSAAYGRVVSGSETLDDAIALVFRAPHSFTGEDTVEISVHGGTAVTRRVLRAALGCGARAAAGGEFTKRAYLNGKLSLSEAEGVMGLITARSDASLRLSRAAKDGRLSKKIDGITNALTHTAAALAVFADYPDDEIPELESKSFGEMLTEGASALGELLAGFDIGRAVREGVNCVIAGLPNVGKSTLMNALCGAERSIVTDIAGTTRDVIESTVTLGDITLNLSDTAGIHSTEDTVEAVGVDRARKALDTADLILAVFDLSREMDSNDRALLKDIGDRAHIVVLNKSDSERLLDTAEFEGHHTVEISAKAEFGLDDLEKKIKEICGINRLTGEDAVLISERQRDCAERAKAAMDEALAALDCGVTLDAVGVCIDDALSSLYELTGKRVTNEVADEVFRSFCVGK